MGECSKDPEDGGVQEFSQSCLGNMVACWTAHCMLPAKIQQPSMFGWTPSGK